MSPCPGEIRCGVAASSRAAWPLRRAYVITLVLAACLYGLTAQRGPAWQDSGYHQLRALRGQLDNPLGLALTHPLLIVMAQPLRALGVANLPWSMNVLSGVGMAVALANVLLLGYWLTGRPTAAILAAATLAVSHTAWWLGAVAETYCWSAAGLTTELILALSLLARPRAWKVGLLALVSGLGFSLHNLALLALPVYAIAVALLVRQRRLSAWVLLLAAGAWLSGAGLQLALVAHRGIASGDWPATIRSALFGQRWQGSVTSMSPRTLMRAGGYILLNWPFLSLVPVALGWWLMPQRAGRAAGALLGAVAVIHLLFAARYDVVDQFMFLLPAYTLLAVGSAVGIDRLLDLPPGARRLVMALLGVSLLLTPVMYALVPWAMTRSGRSIRGAYHLPGRDENRYWISPWKFNEDSARRFGRAALDAAGPDGVILATGTTGPPILIVQATEGRAPGVNVEMLAESPLGLIDSRTERIAVPPYRIAGLLDRRALYIAQSFYPGGDEPLMKQTRGVPAGPLIRLVFPPAADAQSEKE